MLIGCIAAKEAWGDRGWSIQDGYSILPHHLFCQLVLTGSQRGYIENEQRSRSPASSSWSPMHLTAELDSPFFSNAPRGEKAVNCEARISDRPLLAHAFTLYTHAHLQSTELPASDPLRRPARTYPADPFRTWKQSDWNFRNGQVVSWNFAAWHHIFAPKAELPELLCLEGERIWKPIFHSKFGKFGAPEMGNVSKMPLKFWSPEMWELRDRSKCSSGAWLAADSSDVQDEPGIPKGFEARNPLEPSALKQTIRMGVVSLNLPQTFSGNRIARCFDVDPPAVAAMLK